MVNPQMVMYEEEFNQIQAVVDRLVRDANAKVVFIVDKNGQLIAAAGDIDNVDTTSLASLTAGNQNEWRKHVEARLAEKYPNIKLAVVRPCDDQQKKAFEATQTILNAHPDVKLIMAICSSAVPGSAEAVKQSGRTDVKVIGLGLPNDNKRFVHGGSPRR